MRTITAPGVEWPHEIDRSQYSPAMTGTACYVRGFTAAGEPYTPMEFTSRSAWLSYYGAPTNEAERYAYASICEVLNQGGRLYFARLPYDNTAFEKVVAFQYDGIRKSNAKEISANWLSVDGKEVSPKVPARKGDDPTAVSAVYDATPFWEVRALDDTVKDIVPVEPKQAAVLYDLSAIDEFRTGEAKPKAGTFIIADVAFNTYDRIPEDHRKNDRREMIGIMPVVTSPANAMYAQSLIDVSKEAVIGYETIGTIRTLGLWEQMSATAEAPEYAKLSNLTANTVSAGDMASLVNTRDWFSFVSSVTETHVEFDSIDFGTTDETLAQKYLDEHPGTALSACKVPYRLSGKHKVETAPYSILPSYVDDIEPDAKSALSAKLKEVTNALKERTYSCREDAEERLNDTIIPWFRAIGEISGWSFADNVAAAVVASVNYDAFQEFYPTRSAATARVAELKADRDYQNVQLDPLTDEGRNGFICGVAEQVTVDVDLSPDDPRYGWHGKDGDDSVPDTVSREANGMFPTINFDGEKLDRENLKKIGVVVYKMYLDPAEGNKISFEPVESYAGSLCKDDKDPNTGVTTFIDTIINSQSRYINFFSNCFSTPAEKKFYDEELDMIVVQPCAAHGKKIFRDKQINDTICPSMGYYQAMTVKDISISKSIYDGMNKSEEKVSDVIERDIDIVPDAGLANIASYLKAIYGDKGQYDLGVTDDLGNSMLGMWKCDSNNAAVKTWKTVEQKLDNFCKNIRKDCMFIADGPRPMVLAGQKKIVRPTKPTNTIDACIIPNIKWVTGLNTSYGAMYVDWFEQADDYTGDFFWCPPSIKAMGVYINTDVNFNYWDAPAGLNRGVIAATDVAFSPTIKQAGAFYEKNLNYAINYPADGIVLEGQKTLQTKPSALDRVNVRRLCLRLERAVARALRYFLYEGNTAYTRQRAVDAVEPYFKEAKIGGGLYDYKIIADESVNTPDTIDRNEFHMSIGIKPVKTIEFIMVDFILASTGMTWEEAGL